MTGLGTSGLTVRFDGAPVVDDVDLAVPTGSVLAVLGPSGCGKSTLLRAIAGLEQPASGSVAYDGADLARVPTHRRGFALMFQDGQLFAHLDVAANVGYALRLRGMARRERTRRVQELLELVGLGEYAGRRVDTLSGGERQRVALARALAVEPRLLLLDEPLSALDRDLRERLALDLRAILTRTGTTAVFVTHDQEEAFAVADRLAVMREGRLVQQGTLQDVWSSPADAWTARFLGYATVLEGGVARRLLGTSAGGGEVALRRSALRLDPAGTVHGRLEEARVTPEQLRLLVDVPGLGTLPAVAPLGSDLALGSRVGLSVDVSRIAFVAAESGGPST